jgi:hypothetical protein
MSGKINLFNQPMAEALTDHLSILVIVEIICMCVSLRRHTGAIGFVVGPHFLEAWLNAERADKR